MTQRAPPLQLPPLQRIPPRPRPQPGQKAMSSLPNPVARVERVSGRIAHLHTGRGRMEGDSGEVVNRRRRGREMARAWGHSRPTGWILRRQGAGHEQHMGQLITEDKTKSGGQLRVGEPFLEGSQGWEAGAAFERGGGSSRKSAYDAEVMHVDLLNVEY